MKGREKGRISDELGFIAPSPLGSILGDCFAFGRGQGTGTRRSALQAALSSEGYGSGILIRVNEARKRFILGVARGDIDHVLRPLVQVTRSFGMLLGHDANMGRVAKERH